MDVICLKLEGVEHLLEYKRDEMAANLYRLIIFAGIAVDRYVSVNVTCETVEKTDSFEVVFTDGQVYTYIGPKSGVDSAFAADYAKVSNWEQSVTCVE